MRGSFRGMTAVHWNSLREALTIRRRVISKDAGDLPKLGVKTFSAPMSVQCMTAGHMKSWSGFVESTLFNEDMIYAGHLVQAGYLIAYAADAKVVHSHNYGCLAQFHRQFRPRGIPGTASGDL